MPKKSRADIPALQGEIRDAGLDLALAISGENFTYITDTLLLSHEIIPERLCLVIVPSSGDPIPFVCLHESLQTHRDSWITDIRTYVEFEEEPIPALATLLRELGYAEACIGIEKRFLAVGYAEQLAAALPRATINAADCVFDRARAVKSACEIDILKKAARSTETAILGAFQAARPGDTEKRVADDLTRRLLEAGATSRWIVLAAGANTSVNHPYPSDKELTPGEIMRVDVGGVFEGYQSDVARTAAIGSASDEQRTLYKRLREIERETIAAGKPGSRACDLHETCRRAYEKQGLTLSGNSIGHAIGHSLGLGLHEHPILRAGDTSELKPGMLFNVEPAAKDSQGFLYHIEDLFLVTENGPEILTTVMDTEELFVIE